MRVLRRSKWFRRGDPGYLPLFEILHCGKTPEDYLSGPNRPSSPQRAVSTGFLRASIRKQGLQITVCVSDRPNHGLSKPNDRLGLKVCPSDLSVPDPDIPCGPECFCSAPSIIPDSGEDHVQSGHRTVRKREAPTYLEASPQITTRACLPVTGWNIMPISIT